MLNEKKVVPNLRQEVKVKVHIVSSDDIKIYYTGKFQDFTARYIIKSVIFLHVIFVLRFFFLISISTAYPVLNIYIVDVVTGHMIFHCNHRKAQGPVHVVHSENWAVVGISYLFV